MSGDPATPALIAALLRAAGPAPLIATDADAGIDRLRALSATAAAAPAWHAAVALAVRDGFVHDPVRLPAGALQCHWRLELTPAGRERLAREDAAEKPQG